MKRREMGLIFREPRIESTKRQECLAYLEEEMKLKLFREKVDNLFNEVMMNYGCLVQKYKAFKEIARVAKHVWQAVTELVRRKHEMAFIPGTALATSSAWEIVYSDYEALATIQTAAM